VRMAANWLTAMWHAKLSLAKGFRRSVYNGRRIRTAYSRLKRSHARLNCPSA
jgi:hypothetical protein